MAYKCPVKSNQDFWNGHLIIINLLNFLMNYETTFIRKKSS